MPRGRPHKAELVLREEDRAQLMRWTNRTKSSNGLAQRARILLRCADGLTSSAVAKELHVTDQTVCKWRSRYIARGLAGLLDEPRSGAPRKISDEQVEEVVVATLEEMPRDATYWSTRSMAARSGLSHWTVGEIWRAFGLQPHRTETFKLSNDPQFIEKVRDIVGLYLDPPEAALVLCVDERPRSRLSTAPSPCCLWPQECPSGAATTTGVMASLPSSPGVGEPANAGSEAFCGCHRRPSPLPCRL